MFYAVVGESLYCDGNFTWVVGITHDIDKAKNVSDFLNIEAHKIKKAKVNEDKYRLLDEFEKHDEELQYNISDFHRYFVAEFKDLSKQNAE